MKESEDEKSDFISQNKIIFKKYKPIKRIGKGTFSSVYIALYLEKNNYVAIKAEKKNKNGVELLETEAFFLYSLRGFGIPEVISYGRTKTHNILVMPLLGQSLLDLIIMMGKNLHMNDICLIALQILERIEWVHSKNIVYRDIKPENFLFGKRDPEVLYLIDFGLCKKYKSSKTGKHILPKNLGKFTGTSRYASIYSMAGNEQSRRDDIESIGYMIIFLMKKKLPWQGIKGNSYKECYHKLYIMKKNIETEELCTGLPKEMFDYMNNAKSLKFEEEPNYNYLKNLFKTILEKNKFNFDKNIFSWVEKPNKFSERNSSFSKLRRKRSPYKRLLEKISKSIEKKNKLVLKQSDKIETDFSSSNTNNNNNIRFKDANNKNNKNEKNKSEMKNSINRHNEGNSELSNTMKVMLNKNINSEINENCADIPRTCSQNNIHRENIFFLKLKPNRKSHFRNNYSPQNLRMNNNIFNINQQKIDKYKSEDENSKFFINNNLNNINNNNGDNELKRIVIQRNNNRNFKNNNKIIRISPFKNFSNNNITSINDNSKGKFKPVKKITKISIEKPNNFINNINDNSIINKQNNNDFITYNTYNTYNTFNSYTDTLEKTMKNNNNKNYISNSEYSIPNNNQYFKRINHIVFQKNNSSMNNVKRISNNPTNDINNMNMTGLLKNESSVNTIPNRNNINKNNYVSIWEHKSMDYNKNKKYYKNNNNNKKLIINNFENNKYGILSQNNKNNLINNMNIIRNTEESNSSNINNQSTYICIDENINKNLSNININNIRKNYSNSNITMNRISNKFKKQSANNINKMKDNNYLNNNNNKEYNIFINKIENLNKNNYKSSNNIFNNQTKIGNDNYIRLNKMKNNCNNFEKKINFNPNKDYSPQKNNKKKLELPPNYNHHMFNSLKRLNIVNNNFNKFEDNINLPIKSFPPFIYHTENDSNSILIQNNNNRNNKNIRNNNNNIHNNMNLINSNSSINIKPFKNKINNYQNYNNNMNICNELNKNEPIFIEIEPKIISNVNSITNSETVINRNRNNNNINNKEELNNKYKTQVNEYLEDTDNRTNRINKYKMVRLKNNQNY